jgi:fatty-acyl-CoA synthase
VHYATLWEHLADALPDAPALGHGSRRVTWATFEERAARLAAALGAHGVGPDDTVAAYLYNCPEYFEVFFGALKARAVPANINYRYGADELAFLLDNAQAKVLVFDAALRSQVAGITERLPHLLLVEVGDDATPPVPGALPYEELLAASEPAARIARHGDDVFLSYTGGTTGLPKGVRFTVARSTERSLTFRNLFLDLPDDEATLDPVAFAVLQAERGTPMRAIPASPLMHSTGLIFASLPTLVAGGTVTTLTSRSFDADELLTTVGATSAQVLAIVGDAFALPMVRALDAASAAGDAYDVGSLRMICSAGVTWSAQTKQRLLDHIPQVTLLDACGTTEGASYGVRQVRRGDPLSTTNFQATPGLKVLGPDREELPPGEVGMLAGPTAASGYFRDPTRTAETFVLLDGRQYAIPGDLGRVEPDGSVTLIGRGVKTINTGGEKVYPGEVEEAIGSLADVDECLVLGIPDERFGQAVAALIVRRPGTTLGADDVAGAVRSSLAGYKLPRRIRFVERLPRLPNGKTDFDAATALAQEPSTGS